MPVGPELPPHLQKRKRSVDGIEDGAGLPPSKIRGGGSPQPSSDAPKARRILGPSLPPADLSERPPNPPTDDEDVSSSDDDYGPSLPPAPGSAAYDNATAEREAEKQAAASASKEPAKPQRAEWMLAPPSDSDWTSRVDPSKLKARKFASGKGSKAPAEKSGVSAIWTETPEEKRQRLEDEVLGRKDMSVNAGSMKKKTGVEDREAQATAKRIRDYNEKNRGKSLMEEHQGQTPKEKEDDPSARAFDREKDMALSGRLGHGEKKELLKKAGDFGSRFERGSYL